MSIFSRRLQVPLPYVIAGFFIALIAIFVLASHLFTDKTWFGKEGLLWLFALGAVPGLVVALAQFILNWVEFGEISRIKRLGVQNMLLTRDDPNYYGKYMGQARQKINVMGVTSARFFQDFADVESPLERKKILLAALDRNVQVKILIPSSKHLQERHKEGFRVTKERCQRLKKEYPSLFDARLFDHEAVQALVQIDNEVIVGPVFPNKESKNTPVIHVSAESVFAQSYLDNFESEWNAAAPIDEE